MKTYDIAIVGAGAAGLIAAGVCGNADLSTIVVESMKYPARKLRISGKGRCNLTNTEEIDKLLLHFNNRGRFLKHAIKSFTNIDLRDFFSKLGVETIEERGGRVFPSSQSAIEVVDALKKWCENSGAKLITSTPAKGLLFEKGKCVGVKINGNQQAIYANHVLLATGGRSYPGTGSTGDGYNFAKSVGHKIIKPLPSLVALVTDPIPDPAICGLQLKNVKAELWNNGKKITEQFGELLFQAKSISGPIIITLSRTAVPLLQTRENKVEILIDLKPALSFEQLDQRLLREIASNPKRLLQNILESLLPKKLTGKCLHDLELKPDLKASDISSHARKSIRKWLKELRFSIKSPAPWEEAIVTAGGVSTKEINPVTMESKLVPNLYFAGEIIDVDADTGGYNLQAAFSTGILAARSIIEKTKNKNQ